MLRVVYVTAKTACNRHWVLRIRWLFSESSATCWTSCPLSTLARYSLSQRQTVDDLHDTLQCHLDLQVLSLLPLRVDWTSANRTLWYHMIWERRQTLCCLTQSYFVHRLYHKHLISNYIALRLHPICKWQYFCHVCLQMPPKNWRLQLQQLFLSKYTCDVHVRDLNLSRSLTFTRVPGRPINLTMGHGPPIV